MLSVTELMKKLGRSKCAIYGRATTLHLPRKKIRLWGKEEDDFLRENIDKRSKEGIAKKLGRSVKGVRSRVDTLGLISRPSPTWTNIEDAVILANPGLSDEEVAKLPGLERRTKGAVREYRRRHRLPQSESLKGAALFLNWIETNNISEFNVNDLVTQCKITEGLAEKIIVQMIHRGSVNQIGKNSFCINKSKKMKRKDFFQ